MNKNMALISSCLLLFSAQVLADRPAMSEPNTGPAMTESAVPDTESNPAEPTETQSPLADAIAAEEAEEVMAPTKSQDAAASSESTIQTGDTLELQSGETLPVHALDFPQRGTSMENVKKELGEPLEKSATIGDPPITSWSYKDRTIYFEHSKVIHAVSKR